MVFWMDWYRKARSDTKKPPTLKMLGKFNTPGTPRSQALLGNAGREALLPVPRGDKPRSRASQTRVPKRSLGTRNAVFTDAGLSNTATLERRCRSDHLERHEVSTRAPCRRGGSRLVVGSERLTIVKRRQVMRAVPVLIV